MAVQTYQLVTQNQEKTSNTFFPIGYTSCGSIRASIKYFSSLTFLSSLVGRCVENPSYRMTLVLHDFLFFQSSKMHFIDTQALSMTYRLFLVIISNSLGQILIRQTAKLTQYNNVTHNVQVLRTTAVVQLLRKDTQCATVLTFSTNLL